MTSSENPTLSIIIPAYNAETSIGRCVESLLSALSGAFEILVIDDGSSDQTLARINDLRTISPAVKLLHHSGNRNLGVAATRNLGIELARGKYVSFIDADDYCASTRYGRSVEILDENPDMDGVLVSVGVVFDTDADDPARKFLPEVLSQDRSVDPEDFAYATLQGRSMFHISNLVVRRELFQKAGVFNATLPLGEEDTDLWLRMALCGKFIVSDQTAPQVYYRRHSDNNWTPRELDTFRDLKVLRQTLKWAKMAPGVSSRNYGKLKFAFDQKAIYCLSMIREGVVRLNRFEVAWVALCGSLQLGLKREFWGNLLRP